MSQTDEVRDAKISRRVDDVIKVPPHTDARHQERQRKAFGEPLVWWFASLTLKIIDARPVSIDEQLSAAGLSSLDMVNLMIALEAEFDIMIPGSEITPANFRSISTIEALILRIGRQA